MDVNAYYLYTLVMNPYLWMFLSALFTAVVFARITTPIKQNIYRYTFMRKKLWSIGLNAMLSVVLLVVGMIVFRKALVQGQMNLALYYAVIVIVAYLLIRFIPISGYVIVAFIFFSGYVSIMVRQQWTFVPATTFTNQPVMGFYYYPVTSGVEAVILHDAQLQVDRSALATQWRDVAPLANIYQSYASYPKGKVEFIISGYVMESRPEFFFFYPSRYFYPIEFMMHTTKSSVSKPPKFYTFLRFFHVITGFRDVQWSFNGSFVDSENRPLYLYPMPARASQIPLTAHL
ncbi:hypothetical protein PVA45_04410 [Entomospira entomophila]|uniref:Uncharacterized protein n=1 Tax=Entomospira entomophila TaxID=2719988 RepID=A0A968GD25_9SPIO|nr:hypothetical protein [Entomospira entomophilus]NIZ40749.1 hypothetical protein [Entomospira entomophilus]WDI34962.1 hypothetical protein PVA45_04410 [Entomospira entomophilus]